MTQYNDKVTISVASLSKALADAKVVADFVIRVGETSPAAKADPVYGAAKRLHQRLNDYASSAKGPTLEQALASPMDQPQPEMAPPEQVKVLKVLAIGQTAVGRVKYDMAKGFTHLEISGYVTAEGEYVEDASFKDVFLHFRAMKVPNAELKQGVDITFNAVQGNQPGQVQAADAIHTEWTSESDDSEEIQPEAETGSEKNQSEARTQSDGVVYTTDSVKTESVGPMAAQLAALAETQHASEETAAEELPVKEAESNVVSITKSEVVPEELVALKVGDTGQGVVNVRNARTGGILTVEGYLDVSYVLKGDHAVPADCFEQMVKDETICHFEVTEQINKGKPVVKITGFVAEDQKVLGAAE